VHTTVKFPNFPLASAKFKIIPTVLD